MGKKSTAKLSKNKKTRNKTNENEVEAKIPTSRGNHPELLKKKPNSTVKKIDLETDILESNTPNIDINRTELEYEIPTQLKDNITTTKDTLWHDISELGENESKWE